MDRPRRCDICVVHTHADGVDTYELAEIASVRGGIVRSYYLKGDDLFDPEHTVCFRDEDVLVILDSMLQQRAQALWKTHPAGHSWKTREEAHKAIETVLLDWEYN